MRSIFIALIAITSCMETYSQSAGGDRQPVAAGRFYAADKTKLTQSISELFSDCKKSEEKLQVRAIISPHAGYVFSGRTAAAALSAVPASSKFKNIFIIGSSHVMSFEGASVYCSGNYLTPFGAAQVNSVLAEKLIASDKVFNFPENAHLKEHSLEVHIPLLQYYFKDMPPIVPVIIGTGNKAIVKRIAEALMPWFNSENLFVISSDFSHYPPYKEAAAADKATAAAIISGNPDTFLSALEKNAAGYVPGMATSMCGWTSGLLLLYLSEGRKDLEYKIIDYCNSGDSPFGDKDEVVGYNAIALVERKQSPSVHSVTDGELHFSNQEKDLLFSIARSEIKAVLSGGKASLPDEKSIPASLRMQYGAFVTLKKNGALRGCIGRFVSAEPLYKVVRSSAISSAFEDPRFPPVTAEEFSSISMEITVLGPLKKIKSIDEIIAGRHGIYIRKDNRSGTMLPQVATENGWTIEEFLGYTSRDKAGLGWDGWKDADLFIYEGTVLEEKKH